MIVSVASSFNLNQDIFQFAVTAQTSSGRMLVL